MCSEEEEVDILVDTQDYLLDAAILNVQTASTQFHYLLSHVKYEYLHVYPSDYTLGPINKAVIANSRVYNFLVF